MVDSSQILYQHNLIELVYYNTIESIKKYFIS